MESREPSLTPGQFNVDWYLEGWKYHEARLKEEEEGSEGPDLMLGPEETKAADEEFTNSQTEQKIIRSSLKDLLGLFQFRMLSIILILLDTYVSILAMYIYFSLKTDTAISLGVQGRLDLPLSTRISQKVYYGLAAFSNFTHLFFILEGGARYYLFKEETLQNPFNVIEYGCLGVQLLLKMLGHGHLGCIFYIFSLWRLVELYQEFLDADRKALRSALVELEITHQRLQSMEIQLSHYKGQIKAMDSYFQSYNDAPQTAVPEAKEVYTGMSSRFENGRRLSSVDNGDDGRVTFSPDATSRGNVKDLSKKFTASSPANDNNNNSVRKRSTSQAKWQI